MTINAVIFDIDGTLIDSVDAHARAWQEAFAKFGVEIPFDVIRSQIGKGGDKILPTFLNVEQRNAFAQELEAFRADHFRRMYLPRVQAFPDVRALFERLRADGVRVTLASSCKQADLETYKKIANIADLVETETSKDEVESSKPDPDIFAAALSKLGDVSLEETLVVGDSPYDAQAAGKLGLATIGVLCGGFSREDLTAAGCVAIYAGPADLLARYAEWRAARTTALVRD